MKQLLFNENTWYKGNTHMHTTRSDGKRSVSEAVEIYRRNGYDFIALTDHRRPSDTIEPHHTGKIGTEEIDAKEMLILSGVEWDTGGRNTDIEGDVKTYHILGIGMTANEKGASFGEIKHPDPQTMIDTITADGGMAVLAHPSWSVMDPSALKNLHGLTAAEIYNAVSTLPWNGERADSSVWFDIWATNYGICMPAVIGDDVHAYSGDECRTFTMVNAERLDRDAVMDAYAKGHFYASQGPIIHSIELDEENGVISVTCSKDAVTAVFYSNHIYTKERVRHIDNGTVQYHLVPGETYIRIELITTDGRKAWTSPYSLRP